MITAPKAAEIADKNIHQASKDLKTEIDNGIQGASTNGRKRLWVSSYVPLLAEDKQALKDSGFGVKEETSRSPMFFGPIWRWCYTITW